MRAALNAVCLPPPLVAVNAQAPLKGAQPQAPDKLHMSTWAHVQNVRGSAKVVPGTGSRCIQTDGLGPQNQHCGNDTAPLPIGAPSAPVHGGTRFRSQWLRASPASEKTGYSELKESHLGGIMVIFCWLTIDSESGPDGKANIQ